MGTEVTYNVKVHLVEDGSYWAQVEELPGCFATGDTIEELWDAVGEAISLYLSTADQAMTWTVTQIDAPVDDEYRVLVAR